MMKIFIFILLLFPFSVPLNAIAQVQSTFVESSGVYTGPLQTKPSPVVVELFSSQNCPACPPADEYMSDLVKSDGVIALSCHVDYFGKTSAGFGKPFCTQRQSQYIKQIGRKSHFTPQMMINGHMSEIGYETTAVAAAIVKGRSERVATVKIQPKASGVYDFNIPAGTVNGAAEIWMAVYQKPQNVRERGRNITYSHVVNRYIPLGVWRGGNIERAVYPIVDSKSAGFAIVAQEARSGKILAAGDYRF